MVKQNTKFFRIYDKVQKRMNELHLLLFEISCPINVDDFNKNTVKFIKKEKETFKLIAELKGFCVSNQIPFDCYKYYELVRGI